MKIVNKLGGSCLYTAADFIKARFIVDLYPGILVVSATAGTTKGLLDCLSLASARKDYLTPVNDLINTHQQLNQQLNPDSVLNQTFQQDKENILALLQSIHLLKSYSKQQHDWLLGYGEYWSSQIMAEFLSLPWLDAGQIIAIQTHENLISVDWASSKNNLKKALKGVTDLRWVVPGFVAHNQEGQPALLGFNGSDFTAAIVAKLISADALYKWTNLDGIYSADPKWVKSAFAIDYLTYQEAAELAYFGATVLHPQSVQPAIEANIPIHIKNFYKPDLPGTTISSVHKPGNFIVKGLSSIASVGLINLEGTGLAGVCGIAGRLFTALSKVDISVILISQASSEHSISFAVRREDGLKAVDVLDYEFEFELQHGLIQKISLREDSAIVAAVGEGMQGIPGVAAQFFKTLSQANINILAIAQGSSERNISVVVSSEHTQKALRALHGGFYLSYKTISVGLIGPGGVGAELLKQLKQNKARLRRELNIDLRIRGIMNSSTMLLAEKSLKLKHWKEELNHSGKPAILNEFLSHIASIEIPHAAIIDCTSSPHIASQYQTLFASGCHIVTPNKKANSSELGEYENMLAAKKANNRHYLYEATVCAGLPVIKTIQDLLATGDTIKRIEGIVSGTLSYIFHECARGKSFAEGVLKAHELGYTEPDPREDLTGLDVARKFICLAREMGYFLSLDEVELLNLVPDNLGDVSVEEFLKELPNNQQAIEAKIKKLLQGHAAVAYVGVIEQGAVKIQLNAYPASHPFANTSGTDNVLLIQSKRYDKQPLIIQGPGAGADVTAAGVFADLLKLVSML